jgi:hypothetical protein
MYDNTIKDKFVELRAEGQSFGKISDQLGVPKPTLHRWSDERAEDILRLRRSEWEDLEAIGRWRAEDLLLDLNTEVDDIENHLRRFPIHRLGLRDTIMLLRETRRERDRLRALLMGTSRSSGKTIKTERSRENGTAQPRCTNDLRQSQSESFHFPQPENPSAESYDSQIIDAQSEAVPSPGAAGECLGERQVQLGQGEGGIPVHPVAPAESDSSQSVPSVVAQESNKTERFHENGTAQPRNTNDLQQSKPESFDFPSPENISADERKSAVEPDFREPNKTDPSSDESIVIGLDEPASSIAERCGIPLPTSLKDS